MIEVDKLIRENVKSLKPYSSARDEYFGSEGIFLDANENSFGSVAAEKLNRYPDPHQRALKKKLSEMKNVNAENIFMGNGSDEAIDLLIRVFCEPGKEKIMIMPPTYGMYEVCASINNVDVVKVPLTSAFEINVKEVLVEVNDKVKLIFICSPNNPTGNCLDINSIENLLSQFNGLVVIDEAYIDFAQTGGWLDKLSGHNNLVVMQTFSKAWGLANIRLGMAYASEEIISVLNKIKYPYNVNGVTQRLAAEALENVSQKDFYVEQILSERDSLQKELLNLSFVEEIYNSDANFLLVKVEAARNIYNYLIKNLIIVRDRSNVILCENCLRITVGTKEENKKLIESLKQYKDIK